MHLENHQPSDNDLTDLAQQFSSMQRFQQKNASLWGLRPVGAREVTRGSGKASGAAGYRRFSIRVGARI